ncbi:unnamed protein product [Mycena citricolor]|uniref:Glycoside hydrolase family 71 protein n=1 Tax=Mycena citricolor TaxID=2018698 RepID=A0AAD2Q794_9AGAR|nr:unnamed protein product [Mycena citricolor]
MRGLIARFVAALLLSPLRGVDAYAVFAHFMITNTASWGIADWVSDMQTAQAASIDAFALNMAVGDSANGQLGNAFAAAQTTGFQLFISFDYAGNGPWSQQSVIDTLTPWIGNAHYFKKGSSPVVSTFLGTAQHGDWNYIKSVTGCYFIPVWSSVSAKEAWGYGQANGLFSWAAWPTGPASMNTFPDASYLLFMNDNIDNRPNGTNYMMPVSPWFYTNLPGYNKNWLWNGDTLWFDRWDQVFYTRPDFVEIITWNDYGESHYIGPLHSSSFAAFSIGNAPYNYADGMPHDGWRAFLPYLIATYKTGKATITQELLTAWFRLTPGTACADGGTTGNTASQLQLEYPPAQIVQDKIYFAALLAAEVAPSVTVGGSAVPAQWDNRPFGGVGIFRGSAAYGGSLGSVVVTVGGMTVSGQSITKVCQGGITNWNAWVGGATGPSTSVAPSWSIYDTNASCVAGSSVGNYIGLCSFACQYGYCPYGSCVCNEMGLQSKRPPPTTTAGYPAAGLDSTYQGLCSFDCTYGYCPMPAACDTVSHPLATATISPFNPNTCVSGHFISDPNMQGLCSFACGYGMCPMHICQCDATGPQPVLPPFTPSATGTPAPGVTDDGLCSFACGYGYCPSGACGNAGVPPTATSATGLFTVIEWDPNPSPPPGAVSETFVQLPGVDTSVAVSLIPETTVTSTRVVTIAAYTTIATVYTNLPNGFGLVTTTAVIPASTTTLSILQTEGVTGTSLALVTKTPTTVAVAVPTATSTVTVEGVAIVLGPGGQPVEEPVPQDISQPGAIVPTFSWNISPSPNATVIIYTAPLTSPVTWASTVTIPPKSTSPPAVVTGPPGDRGRPGCGGGLGVWSVLFGGIIRGCPPADVGIRGGITPAVVPPFGWTGPWTDPFVLPTPGPGANNGQGNTETQTTSTSTTTSTTMNACPIQTAYSLSDDPENADWSGEGTDPDTRRRRSLGEEPPARTAEKKIADTWANSSDVVKRVGREAGVPICDIVYNSPNPVNLVVGPYLHVPLAAGGGTSVTLVNTPGQTKPLNPLVSSNRKSPLPRLFPIQLIQSGISARYVTGQGSVGPPSMTYCQFFTFLAGPGANQAANCASIGNDIINGPAVGGAIGAQLLAAIDNVANMVWVDKPMNQGMWAKSNVVNRNTLTLDNPPQLDNMLKFISFTEAQSLQLMRDTEFFLRNIAALGDYFAATAPIFAATAAQFQQILSKATPSVVFDPTASLPLIFYNWLSNLLSAYPNGCTFRAINTWNYYRSELARLNTISVLTCADSDSIDDIAQASNQPAPNCLPLYRLNQYTPSTFNFQNLLPPAPNLPRCNVPGTLGSVGYVDSGGNAISSLPGAVTEQIMGSGDTQLQYYAVGSGQSVVDTHYQAFSMAGASCAGVYNIHEAAPGQGAVADAFIVLNCGTNTGKQQVDFNFVVAGLTGQLACAAQPMPGGTNILCSATVAQALSCAAASPFGAQSVQMRWFPQ